MVRHAEVVAEAGGWKLLVKHNKATRTLVARQSQQIRIFRKFETLVNYLMRIGITHFEVDSTNYSSISLNSIKLQPDHIK